MVDRVENTNQPPLVTSGPWFTTSSGQASGGSYISTSTNGATLTLSFRGASISIVGVVPPTGLNFTVNPISLYSIDGQDSGEFIGDMTGSYQYGVNFFTANNLDPGIHTLVITAQVASGFPSLFSFDYALISPIVTVTQNTPAPSSAPPSPIQTPVTTGAAPAAGTTGPTVATGPTTSSPVALPASSPLPASVSTTTLAKKTGPGEPTLGGDPAGATGLFGQGSADGLGAMIGGRKGVPVGALVGAISGAIVLIILLLLLLWLRRRKRKAILEPVETRPGNTWGVHSFTSAGASQLRAAPRAHLNVFVPNDNESLETTAVSSTNVNRSETKSGLVRPPFQSPGSPLSQETQETQETEETQDSQDTKRPHFPSAPSPGPSMLQVPNTASTSWYSRSSMHTEDVEAPPAYEAEPVTRAQAAQALLPAVLGGFGSNRRA